LELLYAQWLELALPYVELPHLGLYMLNCSNHASLHAQWLNWAQPFSTAQFGLIHTQLLNLDLSMPNASNWAHPAQCLKLGLVHAKLPNFGLPMLTCSTAQFRLIHA